MRVGTPRSVVRTELEARNTEEIAQRAAAGGEGVVNGGDATELSATFKHVTGKPNNTYCCGKNVFIHKKNTFSVKPKSSGRR